MRPLHRPPYYGSVVALALAVVAAILWGSLYPFEFALPGYGVALSRLIHATSLHMTRDDQVANVLIYLPFGAVAFLLISDSNATRRILLATCAGSLLSLAIELAQLATAHRVTSVFDWLLNTFGSLVGAVTLSGYLAIGATRRMTHLWNDRPALIPLALVLLWSVVALSVAGRSAPPVDAVKTIAAWWVLAEALRHIWKPPHAGLWMTALAAASLVRDAIHLDRLHFLFDGAGAAAALLGMFWSQRRARVLTGACWAVAALVAIDLWPYALVSGQPAFEWTPFLGSLLHSRDYVSLFEKALFYCALLWLLCLVGQRMTPAFAATMLLTACISLLRLWMPGHPAEITDPLMVMAIAAAFRLALRFQPFALARGAH